MLLPSHVLWRGLLGRERVELKIRLGYIGGNILKRVEYDGMGHLLALVSPRLLTGMAILQDLQKVRHHRFGRRIHSAQNV